MPSVNLSSDLYDEIESRLADSESFEGYLRRHFGIQQRPIDVIRRQITPLQNNILAMQPGDCLRVPLVFDTRTGKAINDLEVIKVVKKVRRNTGWGITTLGDDDGGKRPSTAILIIRRPDVGESYQSKGSPSNAVFV